MRRCAELLGVLTVWAACAGPAAAQDGAGLYEPFAELANPEISRDFVRGLPAPGRSLAAQLTVDELERGVRVRAADLPGGFALPRATAVATRERAEPGGALGTATGWIAAGGVVALVSAGALRLARR
jgi:hypothetical protein